MITVAIGTYNRAASLDRTLQTLAAQIDVDWARIEVLVIDNNCTDNTAGVVSAAAPSLPIRRIIEPAQGLSHARNRILAEAEGDWIIFTDDDVSLDRGWLAAYGRAFAAYPDASFAGGRIVPTWPDGKPRWFRGEHLDLIDGLLGWYEISQDTRMLAGTEPLPFGASFALKRSELKGIGEFRPDLGVNGKSIGRGEETEYMMRMREAGLLGIYVGEALCWHPVELRRLELPALYRFGVASGVAHRSITKHAMSGSTWRVGLHLARGLYQLLKGRGDRFRQCVINMGVEEGLRAR